jgi:hypothetical protein
MNPAPQRLRTLLADSAGFAVLAILYALCLAIYPGVRSVALDPIRFVALYLPFALIGFLVWHQEQASGKSPRWATVAISSIGLGSFFFLCNIAIGHYLDPELPLLTAAVELRGPWGIATTLLVCPGVTFLSVSGWARSRLYRALL